MESRWHLLIDSGIPFPPQDRPAGFAIGPSGVFALVFVDAIPETTHLSRIRTKAEEAIAGVTYGRRKYVPHMLEVMLLMEQAVNTGVQERFLAVDPITMRRTLLAQETGLSPKHARYIATELAGRSRRYTLISTDNAPAAEPVSAEGLFATAELHESKRTKILARPFQEWMTFLDDDQLDLVHRNFNGPARLSGPAGTGKTVVALHRMARFAKNNPGPLLFTSFVKTLPGYHRSGFLRLAPLAADRAAFVGLHAWTTRFLKDRDVAFTLNTTAAEDAFSRTWQTARRVVGTIEASPSYWREEIDRVIKGRGITTLDEYKRIDRTGRNRIRLDGARRETVWKQLYQPYRQRLQERDAHDFNDIIAKAIEELDAHPLDEPFGLVVVDEVQDFTLMELRLVHRIAGGRADAPLLLVGDGQQQVYPGGWRLSDAGIPIKGRGAVLRVNYRNRSAVHDYAKRIDASNTVDDLDGEPGFVLRDTEIVLPGGYAAAEPVRRKEVGAKLVEAITGSRVPWSDIAVITMTNREAERYMTVLARAGISVMPLDKYDGSHQDAVKVGTVHRAKGMDFAAVFHTTEIPTKTADQLTDGERDRADLAARQTMVALTRARDYIWVGLIED
ncbi:UvrD-helicase domain-containing protein [Nocardia iowensis]|uniref:UvrD-helicase domain-containing protein n=2 Tax=Nocardia iowensis TaxID=204891 RepID=A0ABX8S273_NOCIO|nr:UvrD-helicase domain-containing protein [Nocardia iowensis]